MSAVHGVFIPNWTYTALFIFSVALTSVIVINVTSCKGLSLNEMMMKTTGAAESKSCKPLVRYTATASAVLSCVATLSILYALFAGDPRYPMFSGRR